MGSGPICHFATSGSCSTKIVAGNNVAAHIGQHEHDFVGDCSASTTATVTTGTTGASASHLFAVGGRVRLQEYTDEQIVGLFVTDLENALGEDRFLMNSFSNEDGVYTFNFDITPPPPEGGASSADLYAELQAQSADENSELRQGEVTGNIQSVDTADRTFQASYFAYKPSSSSHSDDNNSGTASSSLTMGLIIAGCIAVLVVVVFSAMLIRKRVVNARAKVCDTSFSVHANLVDNKGASSIPTASADLEAALPIASPSLANVAAAVASENQERDRVWVFTRNA